jgi:hypothetical protein
MAVEIDSNQAENVSRVGPAPSMEQKKAPAPKAPPSDAAKSIAKAAAVVTSVTGEVSWFTGMVGFAIVALGMLLELGLGAWTILLALLVGLVFKVAGDYLEKYSNNKADQFEFSGAVFGYA